MPPAEPKRPLPLVSLLLVGMVVPVVCSAVDHVLLSQMTSGVASGGTIVLTLAVFVFQIGLFGVLCGRWIAEPLLRWIIYLWCWVLVDLQIITASALAGPSYYWGNANRLLPSSLFNAQLGLVTIWAVLGTTRWYLRWPAALILAMLCALPMLDLHYHGSDLSGFLFMQVVALAGICGVLRWQRFRLIVPSAEPMAGATSGSLRPLQFGVRHVLIWTTSLAVVLGLARALNLLSPGFIADLLGQRWLVNITAGGLIAIVLVVALWSALGEGHGRLVALLTIAPLAGLLVSASEWYYVQHVSYYQWRGFRGIPPPVSSLAFWAGWWENEWWLVAWTCLAGGLLFAALLIYRTLGYRLTRTARGNQKTAETA
jgi:hypothetical protein